MGIDMKLSLRIREKKSGMFIDDGEKLMVTANMDPLMGYEDIGIQSDGTPVIFDKCGNFKYIDTELFELVIMSDT